MYMILSRAWGHRGNDRATKLLLHCNGDDASTAFRDDSRSDHTITANGNAQLDTAQKKFGKSSALFDGTGDYLSIPDHADWNMGSGKFTIDFWVRFASVSGIKGLFSQEVDPDNQITFSWHESVFGDGFIYTVKEAGNTILYDKGNYTPLINTWYHIALIRGWGGNANDFAVTVNGTAITTNIDLDVWPDLAAEFRIGKGGNIDSSAVMNGWIDEFRVSKGIARWTANFTPPTMPYR